MRSRFLLLLPLVLLWGGPAGADDESAPRAARLIRNTSLTPDGKTLVFGWRGDLWKVPSTGGTAVRLTFHPANDTRPRVSPDGRTIAFVSNREGSDQVFVMPITGGRPRQVTIHTEGFTLYDWFPDGQALLVRARLDHGWHRPERLFRRSLDPDAPLELLFDAYASSARVAPDGARIAFTREGAAWWRKGYRGSQASQVWIYDLGRKTFEKITSGDHGERWPLWDADGRHLWITSAENGTFNLWRHDLDTGTRTQRTFFEDDGVLFPAISADGSLLVFRRLFDTYRLGSAKDATSMAVEILDAGDSTIDPVLHRTLSKATAVAFTDDAREIAFVSGGDLWVMDTELKEPRQITDTPEEERDPVFAPDHGTLYFTSDAGGRTDLWRATRGDEKAPWWLNDTFDLEKLTDDETIERWPWFTPDGKRLAFIKGAGDLWTMKPDGTDLVRVFASWNPPQVDFSPGGAWVAYAVEDEDFNSDVWIRKADGTGTPFNVSRHPDHDGSPTWSPDGRILAFTSSRWREESDICYVYLRREDDEQQKRDRTLEKALEKMEGRKKKKGKGKPEDPIAGTWKGRVQGESPVPPGGLDLTLVLRRAKDGEVTGTLTVPGFFDGDLEGFGVDEKKGTITFALASPLGRLTGEGKLDGETLRGTWRIEGVGKGTFEAKRTTDAKEEKGTRIDFEDLEDRIRRIGIPGTRESALRWSPDSKRLAFTATVGGSHGTYTVSFPDGLKPKRLSTTVGSYGRWLKEGNQIAWLVSGRPAVTSASGKTTIYSFRVHQAVDLAARHAAAFDVAWRVMRDTFYDPRLNNRDWDAVRAKYRPLAAQSLRPQDLEQLVDMMLGELNGSHLGFGASSSSWSKPGWMETTHHLGVRFDPAWEGPGLRIRDVVPRSPADRERSRLEPGEVVLAIDRRPVHRTTRLARVLTAPPDHVFSLKVAAADGEEREVGIRPTTYGTVRGLLYDAVLERRRRQVEAASDGTLGYLHVRGMSWPSFEKFETELYKVAHGKEGLIIDVRDNGGGFTTDHLLTALTQPRHAFTVPRGGRPGYPQDRMVYARWTKPIVVLCNQNSFSNAEIFAHAIRTLGRGQVVGVPTAGGVISTGGTSIMDVGRIRLPFRGWFLLDGGEDMERNGCVPDHVVWPEPGEMPRGIDRQLDKAVEVLLQDVQAWHARPKPTPRYASQR